MNVKTTIAESIRQYLTTIVYNHAPILYFQLDENHCVVARGGELNIDVLATVDLTVPLDKQFDGISELLPVVDVPVVVYNLRLNDECYIDVHMFNDSVGQWVLILDTHHSGVRLQRQQQQRLDQDLLFEQKTGSVD